MQPQIIKSKSKISKMEETLEVFKKEDNLNFFNGRGPKIDATKNNESKRDGCGTAPGNLVS